MTLRCVIIQINESYRTVLSFCPVCVILFQRSLLEETGLSSINRFSTETRGLDFTEREIPEFHAIRPLVMELRL